MSGVKGLGFGVKGLGLMFSDMGFGKCVQGYCLGIGQFWVKGIAKIYT